MIFAKKSSSFPLKNTKKEPAKWPPKFMIFLRKFCKKCVDWHTHDVHDFLMDRIGVHYEYFSAKTVWQRIRLVLSAFTSTIVLSSVLCTSFAFGEYLTLSGWGRNHIIPSNPSVLNYHFSCMRAKGLKFWGSSNNVIRHLVEKHRRKEIFATSFL